MKRAMVQILCLLLLLSVGCRVEDHDKVIVIGDSDQVFLGEPNQPATAPWPYVVLSRGRYQELVRCEMTLMADPSGRPLR